MIKNIIIVTPEYPSEEQPYIFPFVDQLACAIEDLDIHVSVIVPYDMLKVKAFGIRTWERTTPRGKKVSVFSPGAITLTTRKIYGFNMSLLTEKWFIRAVQKAIKKYNLKPDVVYSHFLFPAGTCAAAIGKRIAVPSICAFGESSLWSIREIGLKRAREKLSNLKGVIAVSTHNKNVLIENHIVNEDIITVVPNAVNKKVFCPGDKQEVRKKLGLPQDRIIGIYNGSFCHSKGSMRVAAAAEGVENLSMIYLGGGKEEPQGDNILFKGRVPHEDVATWLKAADFFVLPTLAEGCCNAIIEAMSTGLPIISSDKPFNTDILDQESSILVDPMNIEAIHDAIHKMTESEELREKYSEKSIEKSRMLDINVRAKTIIAFLEKIVQKEKKRV